MAKKKREEPKIAFRSCLPGDREFLLRVYADSRSEELAQTGWGQEQIDGFLKMQFDLQHTQYQQNHPTATFDVVLVDSEDAGRLYVDRRPNEIRIIDIALLHQFRRRGIGSRIMKDLIAEADKRHVPISLHVEQKNPAMQLYERLGFVTRKNVGVYDFMERMPR